MQLETFLEYHPCFPKFFLSVLENSVNFVFQSAVLFTLNLKISILISFSAWY